MCGRKFLAELPEFHIAPTSMKMASLVDALLSAKRTLPPDLIRGTPPVDFNSMTLMVDEWTAFMHMYDDELVGGLTTFYDVVVPYEHHRRGKDIRIKIPRPQLNILAGSTPSNLIKFMPDFAWDQGFTSRVILVYSDERFVGDDFAVVRRDLPKEMIHDIKAINSLSGEFTVSKSFQSAVTEWRAQNEDPKPNHPKLVHYNTRRRTHVYKLAMVAAIDRAGDLNLIVDDFRKALGWLAEAELTMPSLFEAGATHIDARAVDEVIAGMRAYGKPTPHHRMIRAVSRLVPAHAVLKLVEIMWLSGRIKKDGDGYYLPND